MRHNTYLILAGLIGIAEVAVFWTAVEMQLPWLTMGAVVIGAIALFAIKRQVRDVVEDERTAVIREKTALRTLQVTWVLIFAFALGAAVLGLAEPAFRPVRKAQEFVPANTPADLPVFHHVGVFGMLEMLILCSTIFVFVAFTIYFGRKYGEWESDEEQD